MSRQSIMSIHAVDVFLPTTTRGESLSAQLVIGSAIASGVKCRVVLQSKSPTFATQAVKNVERYSVFFYDNPGLDERHLLKFVPKDGRGTFWMQVESLDNPHDLQKFYKASCIAIETPNT